MHTWAALSPGCLWLSSWGASWSALQKLSSQAGRIRRLGHRSNRGILRWWLLLRLDLAGRGCEREWEKWLRRSRLVFKPDRSSWHCKLFWTSTKLKSPLLRYSPTLTSPLAQQCQWLSAPICFSHSYPVPSTACVWLYPYDLPSLPALGASALLHCGYLFRLDQEGSWVSMKQWPSIPWSKPCGE